MTDASRGRQLPEVEPERLRSAVGAVLVEQRAAMPVKPVQAQALIGRLPSSARLKAGATETVKEDAEDAKAAEYFQSLLELGYLAASADGLAAEERNALALLVEQVTDSVVDYDMLQLHFDDLDATCATLGRRERLSRVAANFDSVEAREEAIGFATLVAIADGTLAPAEVSVLTELGEHFALSAEQVTSVIDLVVASIEQALGR